MGNKNFTCLRPKIEDKNLDTNSENKIINDPEHKVRRLLKIDDLKVHSNKSCSFNTKKNFYNQKSKTYLDKVKTIQKYFNSIIYLMKILHKVIFLN